RALFLAPRVVEVRERRARAEWPALVAPFEAHGADRTRAHFAKVAVTTTTQLHTTQQHGDGIEHVWIEVEAATATSVRGIADRPAHPSDIAASGEGDSAPHRIECSLDRVGDWLVRGVIAPGYATPVDVTPESASILR
ncbi:MAG: hypothetical protein ACKO3W_02405, partial [bacterium]